MPGLDERIGFCAVFHRANDLNAIYLPLNDVLKAGTDMWFVIYDKKFIHRILTPFLSRKCDSDCCTAFITVYMEPIPGPLS